MKICALVLGAIVTCNGFALAQSESDIRDRIVGTWKLVSAEDILKDGSTRPFPWLGPHGKGFLMYSRDGYMCADLENPDLRKAPDPLHPTAEEKSAVAEGTFAYCGRYEIDVQQKHLVHLPEVAAGLAAQESYEGSRQIRPYTFENGRLVLSDVETERPGVVQWKIVWEKVR